MFDDDRSYHKISLSGLTVDMKIGVASFERHPDFRQPLLVDVDLYRLAGTLVVDGLADTLDYDRVFTHLSEVWPARPHTDLLETLAEDLVAFCLEDSRIDVVRVRLAKPAVYGGRAVPSVEILRHRRDHQGPAR
ncbi:MAG: dihydroneopterin aldolase [Pseudomonadota bacterium]